MATLKTIFGGVAALALLAGGSVVMHTTGASVAHAQASTAKATVDKAVTAGEIGEQIDGYLGVVKGANPSAAVRAAMSEINIARKSVYSKLAAAQNVQTAVVSTLTGEKQIKKARSGTFVKDASGNWLKK